MHAHGRVRVGGDHWATPWRGWLGWLEAQLAQGWCSKGDAIKGGNVGGGGGGASDWAIGGGDGDRGGVGGGGGQEEEEEEEGEVGERHG